MYYRLYFINAATMIIFKQMPYFCHFVLKFILDKYHDQ